MLFVGNIDISIEILEPYKIFCHIIFLAQFGISNFFPIRSVSFDDALR